MLRFINQSLPKKFRKLLAFIIGNRYICYIENLKPKIYQRL